MHKRLFVVVLILTFIITIITGCQSTSENKQHIYYGTAEMQQYNISSEISGIVSEIKVKEGLEVKAGDIIALINEKESYLRTVQAKTGVQSAVNELDRIVEGASDTAKKAAELGIVQAETNYELSKLMYEKTNIKSALDGIVDTINYSEGEYVMPGSPIATLINPKNIWVKIYVPQKELEQIKLNQEVTLFSDFIDGEIKGNISNISSKAEYIPMNVVTKNDREKLVYEVKINIVEGYERIRAGMLLDVHL